MFRKSEVHLRRRIARRLQQQHWTLKQIAAVFGVSVALVYQWLRTTRVVFYPDGTVYVPHRSR